MGLAGYAFSAAARCAASDIGGVREWLRDGETGRLAAPKSAADLAAGVAELVEPAANHAFGRRGQQLIREEFTAARHLDRLTSIYEASKERTG